MHSIDEVISNFEVIDCWEERYLYLIELGKQMPKLPDSYRTDQQKVHGCVSEVWLHVSVEQKNGDSIMNICGDSDAHIVRGLIAILLLMYSGKKPLEVYNQDPEPVFRKIGLHDHLSQQRTNGLNSLISKIKFEANKILRITG